MGIHDKFANLAERLIAKHGREMILRKMSRVPADATKPWRGPATSTATGYEFAIDVKAVVVEWTEEELERDHTRSGSQRLLVAAKNVTQNLLEVDSLLDEGRVYSLSKGSRLQPGTTAILYDFQVRQ
ncbi:MAG: hypothetical protein IT435_02355 [Phycisphaerales bacterium]|nr:hypothetical protein [Phycisphaerales bacterium]